MAKAVCDSSSFFNANIHSFFDSSEMAVSANISESEPSLVQTANLHGSSSTPSVNPILLICTTNEKKRSFKFIHVCSFREYWSRFLEDVPAIDGKKNYQNIFFRTKVFYWGIGLISLKGKSMEELIYVCVMLSNLSKVINIFAWKWTNRVAALP